MYDQLIGKIKQTNKDCKIYLCKMAPRGDIDVTNINKSIDRLAEQRRNQEVHVIQQSHQYFYGSNGLPADRYFADNNIYLSITKMSENYSMIQF